MGVEEAEEEEGGHMKSPEIDNAITELRRIADYYGNCRIREHADTLAAAISKLQLDALARIKPIEEGMTVGLVSGEP